MDGLRETSSIGFCPNPTQKHEFDKKTCFFCPRFTLAEETLDVHFWNKKQ